MNKQEIVEKLNDLISSCKSGKNQEWDWYHDENWDSMVEHLKEIKKYINKT